MEGMETDDYEWSDKKKEIINEHSVYHEHMLIFMDNVRINGPAAFSELPPKPKSDLKDLTLEGEVKKISKRLTGEALHDYLKGKIIADADERDIWPVFENVDRSNLEDVEKCMKDGYAVLSSIHRISLEACLRYGEWLNVAFELHKIESMAGNIAEKWGKWLEQRVGIKASYARKLRNVANILEKFPGFRKLGVSFNEIYGLRQDIKSMLVLSEVSADFWRS